MVATAMPSAPSLSRRAFLRGALAGGMLAATGGHAPAASRRVIVVGAGLAGLTAALDLRDAGWDVVVLEARRRVGGRVHTFTDELPDGLHAEAGGESIDDNHDRLLAMIARFGLTTEARPPDKLLQAAVDYDGARSHLLDFVGRRDGAVLADYLRFGEALAAGAVGLDPERPGDFPNAAALDRRSLDDFIREQRLVPEAEFIVRLEQRGGFNAEARDVSLLFALQQAAVVADVPDDAAETMRIAGGNHRLVDAMAAALGDAVRLGTPVRGIAYDAGGVRVHAGERVLDAAHVVLAIPPPPLRRVRFDPVLRGPLGAAIHRVRLGNAVKVVHPYAARFWEADGRSGFTLSDHPFAIAWAPTDSYASTGGALSQFITGRAARVAARMSAARRIRVFGGQLDAVYPEGVAQRVPRPLTMAWANEPYTGGGYAVYRPGQMSRLWPAWRDGPPRLHFAGEHTETLAGYMESAVRSGHRVAAAIDAAG